jgi:ABC-type antimicrobial peptide transport system permease subunit
MAYGAAQRTREIGVRVALGATRGQVLGLMIRDGLIVVSFGLVVGLVAAVWLTRSLTGLLHEVRPADPLALASVAALLSAVGLIAAYLPARRATRVSALDALRTD